MKLSLHDICLLCHHSSLGLASSSLLLFYHFLFVSIMSLLSFAKASIRHQYSSVYAFRCAAYNHGGHRCWIATSADCSMEDLVSVNRGMTLFPQLKTSFNNVMIVLASSSVTAATNNTTTSSPKSSNGISFIDGLQSLLGDLSTWFIKRTYQPSIIRKRRKHGFMKRKESVGGRRVLKRRLAKGRIRLGGC